jgi:glycosyltransferase involved in cell wall biosynthesis
LPELVKQGHIVKVIVGSGVTNGVENFKEDGVVVEYLKPENFRKYLHKFNKFSLFPELQKHLAAAWAMWDQTNKGNGFDIIETTDWGLGYTPWLINSDSPPVIITLHGSIGQIEFCEPRAGYELHGDTVRMIESALFDLANVLISPSRNNKEEWSDITTNEIMCIPPAYHSKINKSLASDGLVRVVGRVQHWKGPETLCKAVQALGMDFPGIEWIGRDTEFKGKIKSTSKYLQKQYPKVWQKQVKAIGRRAKQNGTSQVWYCTLHLGCIQLYLCRMDELC